MTKDENKLRAKIFQQAMQACHSNNPIDCVEWFADRIIELEKENAELKKKLKPENCLKLLAKNGCVKFTSDQLTKAKKIIGNLYAICKDNHYPNCSVLMEQAAQFLEEVS